MTANGPLVLAIDQGTSSTRAIAFDRHLRPVAAARRLVRSNHPRPGWVEQDPLAILDSVVESVAEVVANVGGPDRIAAVGLDNQGETVVAWDARTLEPLAPAVVWQCRRSEEIVAELRGRGLEPAIRERTGLPLDAYFSAGKMAWLLAHDDRVRRAADRGTLRFGTVDAWLTARLGDGRSVTDPSTASRTQLLDLASGSWDDELLDWFGLDRSTLPVVVRTVGEAGLLSDPRWGGSLPLVALACDQQAALAGHGAFQPGMMKATYGTGVFVLANAGERRSPVDGLEVSVAWSMPDGRRTSVFQGGVLSAGSMLGWLRDGLGSIESTDLLESAARRVPDAGGVRVLPALAGLGSPWYEPAARGVVVGLTAATTRDHLVRATLDGIAQRTSDVVEAMITAIGDRPSVLRVDGGLTANAYLLERTADLLGIPVGVAAAEEATALGIAGLAAFAVGLADLESIALVNPVRRVVEPRLSVAARDAERAAWRTFVEQARAIA